MVSVRLQSLSVGSWPNPVKDMGCCLWEPICLYGSHILHPIHCIRWANTTPPRWLQNRQICESGCMAKLGFAMHVSVTHWPWMHIRCSGLPFAASLRSTLLQRGGCIET